MELAKKMEAIGILSAALTVREAEAQKLLRDLQLEVAMLAPPVPVPGIVIRAPEFVNA